MRLSNVGFYYSSLSTQSQLSRSLLSDNLMYRVATSDRLVLAGTKATGPAEHIEKQ